MRLLFSQNGVQSILKAVNARMLPLKKQKTGSCLSVASGSRCEEGCSLLFSECIIKQFGDS